MTRFLYHADGRLRRGRMVLLLCITLPMAVFGPALLVAIPSITDDDLGRGALAFLAVALFKVPLMLLFFVFISRNRELPGRRVKWGDDEISEILESLRVQADNADRFADAESCLQRLSADAGHVADQLAGPRQVDALTVALQIDERLIARRRVSSPKDTE